MTQVDGDVLRPGDSWQLPDGLGSITFDGVRQFATFSVAHDPGQAAGAGRRALAALARADAVAVRPAAAGLGPGDGADGGRTLVAVGGLARAEAGGLAGEVDRLVQRLQAVAPSGPSSRAARRRP